MNFHWRGQKESDATTETSMTTRRCDLHQGKVKRCTCHYRVQYARVTCNLIGRLILSTLAFCNMSSTGLRLLVRILDAGTNAGYGVSQHIHNDARVRTRTQLIYGSRHRLAGRTFDFSRKRKPA